MIENRINPDVSANNILPDRQGRQRRALNIDSMKGYNLNTNYDERDCGVIDDEMIRTYLELKTYAEATDLLQFASDHLILTQLGMNLDLKRSVNGK